MTQCWQHDRELRPTFSRVVDVLDSLVRQNHQLTHTVSHVYVRLLSVLLSLYIIYSDIVMIIRSSQTRCMC